MEIKHQLNTFGLKVFVGGCVARGEGSRFRAKAHTHGKKSPHYGWVCFLSNKWLDCEALWKHEAAHFLSGEGHTDKWRDTVLKIGGTLDPVYNAKGYCILRSYYKKKKGVQP